MHRSRHILLAASVAIPIVVLAVLAWSAGRSGDKIAKGVTIQGVSVGDMSAAQARQALASTVKAPAERPVKVKVGTETFTLPAKEAGVELNIDAALAAAQKAGDDGSFLSRGWRHLTGGSVEKSIGLQVQASKPAVNRFIRHVSNKVRRAPQNASISLSSPEDVGVAKGHDGRRLGAVDNLRRSVTSALSSLGGTRTFSARTVDVKPDVTTDEVWDQTPVVVTVSKSQRKVRVFKRGEVVQSYGVAVGSEQYPTPSGQFVVQTKQVNPTWSVPNSSWAGSLAGQVIPGGAPNNPLKARWIGFNGSVGFHGSTETGGGAQSHGCVRMVPEQVIDLYSRVETGTPVLVGA